MSQSIAINSLAATLISCATKANPVSSNSIIACREAPKEKEKETRYTFATANADLCFCVFRTMLFFNWDGVLSS